MSEYSQPNNATNITHARLEWDEQGQPLSSEFGDIYFTTANGLEETRHVFLHHNQLAERWQTLGEGEHFCIAETGFGSGLNFLAAWDLWLAIAPVSAQLHFVTVEKHPLSKTDLTRALALWPSLETLSTQLIAHYPTFVGTGFHRLNFMDGRIKLTLIIDDATLGFTKSLASTHPLFAHTGTKIDAWFLDGFAPSKNPHMWSDALFDVIGKLSKTGTTAATFSAAAIVKNGLRRAGFTIQKVAGFGRKREMVKGIYNTAEPTPNPDDYRFRGSFSPYPVPWTIQANKPLFKNKRAIVIGGGLAGGHSARALAERGWHVTLIERHQQLAQEGSGNPQGVLYAKLSPLNEAQAAFNLASLQYALDYYQQYWGAIGSNCGVLQLAYKPAEAELQALLHERFADCNDLVEFVDAKRASEIAGIDLPYSGIYFPQAGWINPRKLCNELISHENIQLIYHTHATELTQQPQADGTTHWQVNSNNQCVAEAPVVIIANATDATTFEQATHLPIKTIRGQVTYLPETSTSPHLNTVVCTEGYICPAEKSDSITKAFFCTGATFNLKDTCTETRSNDHLTNLTNLREHTPAIATAWQNIDLDSLQGRVAFRCTLPDYLPVVGPLPIVENLARDFAPLRKNAKAGVTTAGSYFTGLYINIGHGARGLAYTPLCAELLAAQINGEILPMATELANALNPARFIIRDIIKGRHKT